ncbi:TonB-dependent receptor plug domain-containing protein [Massilia litorea]|uniref:TonB-dependent receptor n=1 Tax=Massilia litorea TaxID=2769491 RepID=A0A7L9U4D2_9BURK|nr:TonB-dependent receptor [Massilia litorea]QOL48965.1 TonB-dependent receptor [Massilia litorea]
MYQNCPPQRRTILATAVALAVLSLAGAAAAQEAAPAAPMQKVEITGSSIKRVASEQAVPVTTVKAEEMTNSALTTVADVVTSLPVGATNVPSSAGAGTNVNMRGIGINRTLVLLNGRRLANEPISDGFVNVDVIPMSALSRAEVLRDGASSTYGADAVGGVLNFITRPSFKGLNVTAQTVQPERSGGGREYRLSVLGGVGSLAEDGWNVYATVDHHKRSALDSADRPELSSPEQLASLGIAPKLSTGTYAQPANIFSPSTGITGNPYYSKGCTAPYSVPAPKNTCALSANYILALPGNAQTTFFSKGSLRHGDDKLFTAELLYAKEHIKTQKAPTTSVGFNGVTMKITPSSPYYPGGSAGVPAIAGINGSPLNVSWSVAELGPAIADDEQQNMRLVLADEGKALGWDYRLGFVYAAGRRDSYFVRGYLNGPQLNAGVLNGILNPFGTQDAKGLDYLKSISVDGNQIRHTTNVYTGVDTTFTRELVQLGGGALTLATGAEFHHDGDEDRSLDGDALVPYQNRMPSHSRGSRNIAAAFAELDLPFTKELDVGLAVRGDRYSDFGSTVNPKLTVRWQPTKLLMLRGSASTGFRAPTIFDRYGYRLPGATALTTARWDDPLLCPGGRMGVPGTGTAVAGANPLVVCNAILPIQQGSNPDVEPEKARNLTAGVVVEPIRNATVSVDWYDIRVRNSIGVLAQNAIFTNTAKYADLFVRNPDGSLAYVKDTTDNLGDLRTSGIDLGLQYKLPRNPLGDFRVGLEGTYVTRFQTQNEKGGEWISNLGRFGSIGSGNVSSAPTYTFRWKHTARLSWNRADWFGQLTNFYNTGYHDLNNVLPEFRRDISSYSIWNLTAGYKGIPHTTILVGVSNLADTRPPATNSNATGYANNVSSPIGRAWNLRLSYDL